MKKRTTNLAHRLRKRIWWLGVFIAGLSAVIVLVGSRRQEDTLLQIQAQLALDAYLERNPEVLDGAPLAPMESPWFSVYRGEQLLPERYRAQARKLRPGLHELGTQASGPEEYFLVVKETREGLPRLYLLFDVRDLNRLDELLYSGWAVLLAMGAAAAVLALLLTTSSTQRFFTPISSLVETIETASDPGQLAAAFDRVDREHRGDPEEVRELRDSLRTAMTRIDRLVQREREFSRNASHELRTPLTVIRSAAELLGRELDSHGALRRIGTIERAAAELEQVIDTFLCLARDELPPEAEDGVDLERLARSVVDRNSHLLSGRDVEVRFRFPSPVRLAGSDQVVSILLVNLIRNSFASTQAGIVAIEGDEHRLRVLDTGPGVSATEDVGGSHASANGGFGLRIVEDLCSRLGWTFALTDRPSGGAVAELRWPAAAQFGLVDDKRASG